MKKMLIACIIAAAVAFITPVSAKADNALNYATNLKNMQYNYMTQQNAYYNQYQVPGMQEYDQVMSNQISQALAATYQAQMMQQQALQRQQVNDFQVTQNILANSTNFTTQMYTLGSNMSYNTSMQLVQNRQMMLNSAANTWGMWTGQYVFPQVP